MEIPSQSTYLMEFHAAPEKLSDIDGENLFDCLNYLLHQLTCFSIYILSIGLITAIVELLERYIGVTQQIFRKSSEGTTTVIFELCKHTITTVQIKSSGLILLNIDVSSEENLSFNYQVSY